MLLDNAWPPERGRLAWGCYEEVGEIKLVNDMIEGEDVTKSSPLAMAASTPGERASYMLLNTVVLNTIQIQDSRF
jgi:hypothetical protein